MAVDPPNQSRKLGLKVGMRLLLDNAPANWRLGSPHPELLMVEGDQVADVVLSFFNAAQELGQRLPALAERIRPDGALWLCWPRRAGGHTSDITDNIVRAQALALGIVDNKVAALDADWSALRFVWRLELRAMIDS
jgi:hypothetical protein